MGPLQSAHKSALEDVRLTMTLAPIYTLITSLTWVVALQALQAARMRFSALEIT